MYCADVGLGIAISVPLSHEIAVLISGTMHSAMSDFAVSSQTLGSAAMPTGKLYLSTKVFDL